MTGGYSDIQRTSIAFDGFAIPTIDAPRYYQTHLRFASHDEGSLEALGKICSGLVGRISRGRIM